MFDEALKRALTHSTRYMPKYSEQAQNKFGLYVELVSVDVAENKSDEGKRSVVSIVIQEFINDLSGVEQLAQPLEVRYERQSVTCLTSEMRCC
jgi:hypothetical protein